MIECHNPQTDPRTLGGVPPSSSDAVGIPQLRAGPTGRMFTPVVTTALLGVWPVYVRGRS